MSRTITALFDSRSEAEAARARLTSANIDADNVRIVDQENAGSFAGSDDDMGGSSSSSSSYDTSSSSSSSGGGFWAGLKDMFVPDEDRHTYNEGISRGGVLLYASVDDDDTDRAIDILEQTGSIDMDEREKSWKSEGWAGYSPSSDTRSRDKMSMSGNADEERIQLAEEELRVGKREVNRGGARIRSYVTETPVTEHVQLREEHVNVERRPVEGNYDAGNLDKSALFQDRTIEMSETSEEVVVDKQARVTEEVVLSKTSDTRDETISDTVRKTEVDIDEDMQRSGERASTLGGSNDRDRF